MSLLQHTRELLHKSELTIPEVYAQMYAKGSDITVFWLRKFSSGEIPNPGIQRVEELYEFLTGEPVIKV